MAPVQSRIRQRIYIFDGTWANRNWRSNNTLLAAIHDLIAASPGTEIHYVPGVGARSGWLEKYIAGGLATREIKTNIIKAVSDLSSNFHPGDEVVVIGYSRGSYAGRCFVGFLDRVGLPASRDRHILHDLYDMYTSGKFLERGVADHLREKYQCRHVPIKTMMCLDTVGSLGIPRTGIFGPTRILDPFIRKNEFMETNASSNVGVMLHALALQENRGAFPPTLMHMPENNSQLLKQVWFVGSHGDIAREIETGCIADIVLAWAVSHLEEYAHIGFDEAKLKVRFPRIGNNCSIDEIGRDDWIHDPVQQPNKGLWRLMGYNIRISGTWYRDGMRTNEFIHATVRLRGYGSSKGTPPVLGYLLKSKDGGHFWEREHRVKPLIGSRSYTLDSLQPQVIHEVTMTARECQLLGIAFQ